jgi:hypothetical protein
MNLWLGDGGVAAGAFSDSVGRATAAATSLASSVGVADQIAIRQSESQKQSHTAGFEVRHCNALPKFGQQ